MQRGDAEAFRSLVGEHQDGIAAVLWACGVRDPETARDLTQEVLLRCWQRIGSLRDRERFGPWLRQIAANAARDHLRVSRAAAGPVALEEIGELEQPGALPDRQLGAAEELRRMAEVLEREDPEAASMLLESSEGRPSAEIGRDRGLSAAAVRMKIQRLRKRLRREL